MNATKAIGITMGDPGGVGPEVLLRALAELERSHWPNIRVFGDLIQLEQAAAKLNLPSILSYADVELVETEAGVKEPFVWGTLTERGAVAQVSYIQRALDAVAAGDIGAIVTGPIHKQALALCHLPYHGHTEWLADAAGVEVAMMLAGPRLRVVPATCHIPLADVPQALTHELIWQSIVLTHRALTDWFGIETPRIAVCGLNPHAGDGGLLGKEDDTLIAPVVREACAQGMNVDGPSPADTVFYFAYQHARYDAVIAMYHDQALAPLKLVHFEDAINLTLGLPFVRTSVDHGTAYDIAGTGQANPTSMKRALEMAAMLLSCKTDQSTL